MKLEVGKKYTDGCLILEVKFFDHEGTAWCLTDKKWSHYILKQQFFRWTEVTDKPDPGEGWRLLEPDEDLEEGDEIFDTCNLVWLIATESEQYKDTIYRRRTNPQHVPYTWDDREELRGRWFRRKVKELSEFERFASFFSLIDGYFYINFIRSDELLNECEWLDGSPCGKKVV